MNIRKDKSGFFLILFLCALLLNAPYIYADEFHYSNILIGERPSGMGGAYTAVSDDPAGLYYNPAGIAYAQGGNFSASVNAYYTSEKTYDNAIKPHSWKRESSSLLPNFFGIIQPVGRGILGLSYAVPDSIVEDQDQVFPSFFYELAGINVQRYVINTNKEDNTYNFGPSYAIRYSDSLSFGLTLYYHVRRYQFIQNTASVLPGNTYVWANSYTEWEESGIRPILGVMWSPETSKFSVGFTLAQTMVMSSAFDFQYLSHNGTQLFRQEANSGTKRELPLEVKLGIAYFPNPSLLISADISYYASTGKVEDTSTPIYQYSSVTGEATGTATLTLVEKRESVLNLAIGVEYYISSRRAIRGGFYTNYSNTPDVSSSKTYQDEHVDLYGLSFSYTLFTRSSSLTLGTVYNFGNGDAQVNADAPSTIQSVSQSSLLLFISTSYSY